MTRSLRHHVRLASCAPCPPFKMCLGRGDEPARWSPRPGPCVAGGTRCFRGRRTARTPVRSEPVSGAAWRGDRRAEQRRSWRDEMRGKESGRGGANERHADAHQRPHQCKLVASPCCAQPVSLRCHPVLNLSKPPTRQHAAQRDTNARARYGVGGAGGGGGADQPLPVLGLCADGHELVHADQIAGVLKTQFRDESAQAECQCMPGQC